MDGWLGAIGDMFSWAEGSSLVGSLVRVAAAFGLMRWISGLTNKNPATTVPDNRIQVPPSTENKIPVAYGASYFNGTLIDVQLTNNNLSLYAVIVLCETTGNLLSTGGASSIIIDNIYLDNKVITFASNGTTVSYVTDDTGVVDTNPGITPENPNGLISINLYQGNSSSPMLPCQPGTSTPITGTVPPAAYSVMPGWNNTYMCENTIFAVVKLNYDPNKGQHSIPNLKFHVVNSMSLPGDCLYDYMTNDLYGASIDPSLINTSSFTALNTYSAQSVTYTTYPAQQRYAINGLLDTSRKVLDNMDLLASTAASYITYDISSGKWSVLIQQVISQTFTFSDHNIIGQVNAVGTALDSYYNAVEVQFPYAYLRDQTNYLRIDLPSADRDYNEPLNNVLKVQHDFVNNQVQAAILANILLRQAREDLVVTFKTDFSSYNLQIGDVFGLTNATYGFTNRQFQVIKLVKNEDEKGELTIEVTGLSYSPDVYAVDSIAQFTPLLGTTNNPTLGAIQTPIAPTVVGTQVSSQPGITITATVPAGVVTEMQFWGSSDGTNYVFQGTTRATNSGPFVTGSTTSFTTIEAYSGTWYFKVRGANTQGTSALSPASVGLQFTYLQAPTVLPYTTPVTGSNGQQALAGLGLGILAAWGANQLLGTSLSSLGSLFGLSNNQVSAITANAAKQFTGGVTTVPGSGIDISSGGVVSLDPSVVDALITTCTLTYGTKYPADRSIHENPEQNTSGDRAPNNGNYWISATSPTGASLTVGTGKAYLYKSDGTLVNTISGSAITITNGTQINLAFGSVAIGVDYYILMDLNVATDGTCFSPAIKDPYSWNFHTANPQDVIPPTPTPNQAVVTCPPVVFQQLKTYLYSYYAINPAGQPPGIYAGQVKLSPDNTRVDPESNIGIMFNQPIVFGTSGTIKIYSGAGLIVFQTFDITSNFATNKIGDLFWIDGNTLWLNPTQDMVQGTTYWINITANCIRNACNSAGNSAITDQTTITWTVDNGSSFRSQ